MGESKKDPLELAYEQLLEKLETYKPLRQHFDPSEVEFCRGITARNLKSSYSQACWDAEEKKGVAWEEGEELSPMTTKGARSLIRFHLNAPYAEEPGPKTKIQLNIPTGTAQLLEIWAKREDRPVSSCLMEAALRGLSAMKADGHIPAAVLAENEWHIRLAQIHEDIRNAMGDSLADQLQDES